MTWRENLKIKVKMDHTNIFSFQAGHSCLTALYNGCTTLLMPANTMYMCELCHFRCSKLSNYNTHLSTRKHKHAEIHANDNVLHQEKALKQFTCNCGAAYKYRGSLWNHKKKCTTVSVAEDATVCEAKSQIDLTTTSMEELISTLLYENKEIKKMLSQCLNQGVGIINNTTTNTNSHNKTFNLNVFLNEDCKDAMNLTDFVDSFQLQLSDLESVGDLGYVAGMSKIIVDKLNALDIYKRPIHCTDLKREILHIKDGNKWEKDTGNRRLRQAIKRISKKNTDLLLDWKELHPDVQKPNNRFNDQYLQLIIQSCGGSADIEVSEDKIIKNIAKQVTVEK
jgi:hypothetical protein